MEAELITAIATRSLLLLGYTPTLIHIIRGTAYKPIIRIVATLIVSNLLLVVNEWFYFNLFVKNPPVYDTATIWGYSILVGLGNLAFNVSHLELAWIYRNVAISTPLMLEGQESLFIDDRKARSTYQWLMVFNVAFPVVQVFAYAKLLFGFKSSGFTVYTNFDTWLFNIANDGVGLM
jgi:hypothetical protein